MFRRCRVVNLDTFWLDNWQREAHPLPLEMSALLALSRLMKSAITALLFLTSVALCSGEPDFEAQIKNLAEGKPDADIKAALAAIKNGGTAAFPALLAHLSDFTVVEPRYFQRDAFTSVEIDGVWHPSGPLMSSACFDLIQDEIEGVWPKFYRSYYVLSTNNVKEWLKAHEGLTLAQLRRVTREESLRRAKESLAKDPASEFLKGVVEFLNDEVKALGK